MASNIEYGDQTIALSKISDISLKCEYSLLSAILYIILWVIISVLTLGLGLYFATYYFYRAIINKTYVVNANGERIGRLQCELGLGGMFGHILLWIVITVLTLGIGLIFYMFRTLRLCLSKTRMVQP
ncbi:DUF6693 family protein [Nitratireductor sp. CH_MIT9313-5]|uniref:DUF6693 family protein n=1 Tax=Nitratireductor sp. CH_MIT9313-5 TaxID=3107764 RepID=UPI003007FCEC